MTNQSTIDKLMEMRLTAMADAFRLKTVPFEDRFGMLVDIEFSSRKNRLKSGMIKMPDSTSRMQVSWISITHPGAS